MWLFSLLDPFIPTQIKFLATPLVEPPAPLSSMTGSSPIMCGLWFRVVNGYSVNRSRRPNQAWNWRSS